MPAPRSRPADQTAEAESRWIPRDPTEPIEGEEADSSEDSSAATEPVDYFEDTGEQFDGRDGPDADRAAHTTRPDMEAEQVELVDAGWDARVVREHLETTGLAIHAAAGKGDTDWVFTQRELRAIAPPLTRILNRYPMTAAAGAVGDELAVLFGLGGYTIRSVKERAAAIKAAEEVASLGPLPGIPHPPPEHEEATRLG